MDYVRENRTEADMPVSEPFSPSASKRPERLRFEDYFLGPVRGWGIFQDRFGKVRKEFTVEMHGERTADRFILHEDFRFADGRRDLREWHVTALGGGRYEARAGDIVGVARGTTDGAHMRWRYLMRVPVGERLVIMRFDDRMFLQPDGMLINVSEASKWGVRLGRLSAAFRKDA